MALFSGAAGIRRILDVTVATVALAVGSPLCLLAAAAILVTMGRPVLFSQVRAGRHGRPFRLFKFRTMSGFVAAGEESAGDQLRITRLGGLLRRLSIDEVPQFYNVLRSEMSLVGPRPLLMEYVPLYSARQARRHEVKPGVTGWAQVSGRNALSWEERLELDVWYVDNRSLRLDVQILARTALQVLHVSRPTGDAHQISPRFRGEERA
jgi:lipopolysaccharide/colanic/teichoic acid biosynthesis glycosyltransferase